MINLESILEEAKKIVLEIGKFQRIHFNKNDIKIWKKEDKSLVTNVDIESSKYLIQYLGALIKDAEILSEEEPSIQGLHGDFCWVIDPLDGTRNFTCGIPYFAISVALLFNKQPILGIIYNPISEELFYAQKGKGAFLNGKPLDIKNNTFKENFVLGLCGPSTIYEVKLLLQMIEETQNGNFSYRKLGSAALNIAYVAAGRFNASLCLGVKEWDIAAGVVIILEAGGLISPVTFHTNGNEIEKLFTSDRNNFKYIENLVY